MKSQGQRCGGGKPKTAKAAAPRPAAKKSCCGNVAAQANINHPSSNAHIIPPGMLTKDVYFH